MSPLPNYFEFGIDKIGTTLSTHATQNDAVIRSDKNMILQSGTGDSALYIKTSNNKVGISNSNPSEVLDVIGNIKASAGYKTGEYGIVIDTSGNFTGVKGTFSSDLTVDTNTLFVDSSNNNIGIGTSTPDTSYKLHIKGNTRIEGDITVNGTTTILNTVESTTERLDITNDGTGPAAIIKQTGAESILKVFDGDNICFFIEDNGHVLIGGAPNGSYHFDVSGNAHFINQVDISGNTDISGNINIGGNADISGNLTVNTNVLFVDTTLNKIGINDNTPEFELDVSGSIATNNAIIFNSGTDGLFGNRSNNNTTDFALLQTSTGKTVINCKSGSGNIEFKHGDGTTKQEFDLSGNIIIQGNLFSYSDARIKTNIETIPNALDKVVSIRGVTYNMIKDIENNPENAPKYIGVIAQEIENVIPEAVKEENGIKTVAYGNIVGLLIEAIKEIKEQLNK